MNVQNTIPVISEILGSDARLFVELLKAFEEAHPAEVEHFCAGGVYVKIMRMDKGGCARQHTHHYDHLTVVASGAVAAMVDGAVSYHDAPTAIVVRADRQHNFLATKDGTVCLCVHKVRDEDSVDDFVKIPWREK